MIYSEMIPNNLGVIFRKEFVDLRDSTLIDFEKYTNKKVNSQRNVDLKNGSRIMFRHLEEMNNLQNLNLGWFFIEQAEELKSNSEFITLWGRLRRQVNPSQEFLDLGLPLHSGLITANVKGHNWIYSFWKNPIKKEQTPDPNPTKTMQDLRNIFSNGMQGDEKTFDHLPSFSLNEIQKDFGLTEAITWDNADVLPKDFLESLLILREIDPKKYARFVMNDWDVEAEGLAISPELIEACIGGEFADPIPRRQYILGSDLAKHRDWTVIIVADKQTGQIVYFDRFQKESWALVRGKIAATAKRYNNAEVIPDSTGVGDPITEDLERAGCRVYKDGDRPGYVFTSRSKEQLIENLIVTMTNRGIKYPRIPELIDEMKEFEKTETKAGNIQYSAPQGKHDDCVITLALTAWGLNSIVPQIRVLEWA